MRLMKGWGLFRSQFVLWLWLFCPVLAFSQVSPELVIPEGIQLGIGSKIVENKDNTQVVLSEKNKIIVWDLIENSEKYNVKFSSEVRSLAYHPSGKYIYVSTDDNIYILNAENGNIISQRLGTNYYLDSTFTPFIGDNYLYEKDYQFHIASIFSEDDKQIEIQEEDFYISKVQYDLGSEKILLSTLHSGIYVYDKNLQPYSQTSIKDFLSDDNYIYDNKLFSCSLGTSPKFKVYDLRSGELLNEMTVEQEGYSTFYNKTKKYVGHYQNKLILYENDSIIIKDIVTEKIIKSVPLKFKEIEDIVLSEKENLLLVYGSVRFTDEYGYELGSPKDINIYDLRDYSLKEFENRIEGQYEYISMPNTVLFDEENFYIYRFTENKILKNEILTGNLERSFQFEKGRTINTYPINVIINDEYILASLEDENYKDSIICIDIKTNKTLWSFDVFEDFSTKIEINKEKETLLIKNESYPNYTYTILDIATGKILFKEELQEKHFIHLIDKHKILKLLSYKGGDWKKPVYELHISEYDTDNNKITLHKISVESSGYMDDVLQKNEYLYVKYTDKLLTFNLNDLSKPIDSVNINMRDYKLIDIYDNQYLYIQSIAKDSTFRAYSLTDKKMILEQEDLTFIDYVQPLNQVLVKDSKHDLYLFDITTQQLSPTEINLSQVDLHREFKIFHDRWLVYIANKNQIIYDLENNRIKHRLDNFLDIESISKDGNLYYDYGVIKHSKDNSEFSVLANEVAIPQSMSDVSLGNNANEIIFLDRNILLNILNLANNKMSSFHYPNFTSHHNSKYKQLSSNLFLLSSKDELAILNIDNNKLINLSENTIEIQNFEIDDELLIITASDWLKIFNLNNAEQILDTKSYQYKKLNENLIVFKDLEKISLYSIKRNSILWETEVPNYIGSGQFSSILDNTIFTTLSENEIAALDLRTGKIKSRHTLSSNALTMGGYFGIETLSIHPKTNHLYVNIGNVFETKYQVFEYKNNEFVELNIEPEKIVDVEQLKQEFHIDDEDDNFSLNNNILAIHRRKMNVFLVYDTQTESVLFEQKLDVNDPYDFTWDVSESEKIIFMYNNLGDIVLIDYGNNKLYKHNIDGNKFIIDKGRLFVSDYGKKIDVYDLNNKEKITKMYSLIPLPNKEYMFYTDEGYYLSTKDAAKDIQFKLNGNLYSFEQFDLIYNRPDLVLKTMQSTNTELIKMYEEAYQKRLKRQEYTVTTSPELAPDIEIINKELNQANENIFELTIKADGKSKKLSKIVIKVNDNLYKEITVSKKTFLSAEKIVLNHGNNNIEVYALNDNKVKSISDRLEIFYKSGEIKSPKVYFFGIGVADYEDDNFDLKYSSKDIRDMAKTLSERYSDIDINLLLDSEVTTESIRDFKQKLSQVQTDDIVIISFCGHGVLDKDYNWYFATHDLDFNNPQKNGFSYDDLIDLTNNIKSRQKLVTIDACHSGEVDAEEIQEGDFSMNHQEDREDGEVVATKRGAKVVNVSKNRETSSFALMKQMFSDLESSNGTIVISASGGMEYAFEGGDYQNGVFTYSILNLLYDSVWNTLKISELQKTVMENVYKLTDGKQQPNVRTGTLNYDWVVW